MYKEITYLCLFVVLSIRLKENYAATKVFYQFHISQAGTERNETGSLRNGDSEEPELVITGNRTSSILIGPNEPNATKHIYTETATYTADNGGYHVNYNISLRKFGLDIRLDSKLLKTLG